MSVKFACFIIIIDIVYDYKTQRPRKVCESGSQTFFSISPFGVSLQRRGSQRRYKPPVGVWGEAPATTRFWLLLVKVGKCIYIALIFCSTRMALRRGSHSFTCNYTNARLYLVSVHQMAPPESEVADI